MLVAALAASAGIYVNHRLNSAATDHAVELVPADARLYLHVFLKPSTSQRRALQDLLDRFPQTDEDDEASTFVSDLLREALARFDVPVDGDAGEWLGNEAAAYLPSGTSSPVVLLEIDDEELARTELESALTAHDRATMQFVDDFVVIGEPDAIRVPERGGSLGGSTGYRDLVDELGRHRIALLFTASAAGAPIATVLRVTPSSIVVDAVTPDRATTTLRTVRGFLVASLTGVRGALSIELPRGITPATIEDAIVGTLPNLSLARNGKTLTVTVGGAGTTERIPADLVAAAEARLGDGFDATVAIDASAFPAAARSPLLAGSDVEFRPLLERFLTFNLGVREGASHTHARLVITFASA